jgi:thiol-disulfide isomerase/thioredoxin
MPTPALRLFALFSALPISALASGARLDDIHAVPHLDAQGKEAYRTFLTAQTPRAFAIASGGAWGWSSEASSTTSQAEQEALVNCQANSRQRCVIYAANEQVVLDNAAWTQSWGPYKTRSQAGKASIGTRIGDRFPDLQFADEKGKPVKMADLRSKVVLLHFWGTWCPPCRREMPELAKLAIELKATPDIRFVVLQVREDFANARTWAKKYANDMPLHDSGMSQNGPAVFRTSDRSTLPDRQIAMAFPTSYVLDKHGIVVFSHVGPISGWTQYRAFLKDVAKRSGV